jgi:hypothetical protein
VAVDGIVIPRWFLQPLREALEEAGHEVAYPVLRAPLAACLERVRTRDSTVADPAVIEQLCDGDAADDVAQRLRDGTLALR